MAYDIEEVEDYVMWEFVRNPDLYNTPRLLLIDYLNFLCFARLEAAFK